MDPLHHGEGALDPIRAKHGHVLHACMHRKGIGLGPLTGEKGGLAHKLPKQEVNTRQRHKGPS